VKGVHCATLEHKYYVWYLLCMLLMVPPSVSVVLCMAYCSYWSLCSSCLLHVVLCTLCHSVCEVHIAQTQQSKYATLACIRLYGMLLVAELLWITVILTCLCMNMISSISYDALSSSCSNIGVVSMCTYVLVGLIETSVHPYDVLECEPELVSGYYVDYGGVVFMLIYLSEGILVSCLLLYLIAT